MAKDTITFNDIAAVAENEQTSMKFDMFEGSTWRHKLDNAQESDQTKVRLSNGKSITVDTKFLRFLRVLAEELSTTEHIHH